MKNILGMIINVIIIISSLVISSPNKNMYNGFVDKDEGIIHMEDIKREEYLRKELAKKEELRKQTQNENKRTRQSQHKSLSSVDTENAQEEIYITQDTNTSGTYLGEFTVTSYAIGDGFTPGVVTANGTDISNTIYSPEGYRVIAVDTNVIPMNSIVRVTLNGNTFLAKACDTGSAINGYKIDLLVSSPSEAQSNGIMSATIELVE